MNGTASAASPAFLSLAARAARAMLATLAAAVGGCGGDAEPGASVAPAPPDGPARRVILITCDTLRADRLGAYGYERPTSPQLDAFAQSAVLYEQAYTSAPVTGPALSSLMTGKLPDEIGVSGGNRRFMPGAVETLAEIVRAAGLPTGAVVSNWVLRRPPPEAGDVGLPQGFDQFDDRMTERELNRTANERIAADTTDAAIGWLQARLDQGHERFFLWVHYQDPHGPYTPPDDFARRFERATADEPPLPLGTTVKGKGEIPNYQVLGDERRPGVYRDRYDAEIACFDEQLGRLLDFVSGAGLLDDALVVFSADHGEALGEHGYWFCHGETTYAEAVRVPLIVRFPGSHAASGRRDELVGHLDLFPTVLEALGLPSRRTRGHSLFTPPPTGRMLAQSLGEPGSPKRWHGLTDGRWRLVAGPDGTPRLFDLAADPREEHDLAAEQGERVALLQRSHAELMRSAERVAASPERVLSPEDEAILESLGYTGEGDEADDHDG
jgi:arylsulfatase A-like enzyme